ncbi:MAG: single-stranded DNA-binding protein [Gammaproteobacteria bacterium]|nr:MAG: single-stranded DNA-binding protein [Gammaproteobacteria bacterium]
MNVFTFSGNLGKDCRKSSTQNGTVVCGFPVAVKSGYGDNQQTVWVDCTIWGKRAETGLTSYLNKGQQVVVSGELGTREYEGKTYITCRVNDVDLVGGKNEKPQQASQPQMASDSFDDDTDIPF